jgi:gluconokinase
MRPFDDEDGSTMNTPAQDPVILTLDIGTSSMRAMLFDNKARAVPEHEARIKHEARTTPDGGAEFDAAELLDAAAQCIDHLLDQAGELAARVAAVGCTTLVSNVLGVDEAGVAITPVYTWADTRSAVVAAQLRMELDEAAVHDRTGCLLRSSYLPAQLRWLAQTDPGTFGRVRRWMSFGEYVYLRFFGETAVSYSVASWTGLLDRRTLQWDDDMLRAAGITPDHLSPLVDRDQPLQGLRPPWAERWPALADVPWFPAVGDGAASSIGCGCTDGRRMALALGTSGALRLTTTRQIERIPRGLWVYRVDRERCLLGGALSEGGSIWAWMHDTLQLPDDEDAVERDVAALAPDAHGLTVLPFLAGERSPGWHSAARAVIAGLSLHTQPVEILRAGLESIGYRFAELAKLLAEHTDDVEEIIASGGPILHSPTWSQIIADVLGRPIRNTAEEEATSRGVALMALHSLGHIASLDALPAAMGSTFEPNAAHRAAYERGAQRHATLYSTLVADR